MTAARKNGTETGKVGPGKPPVEHQFKAGNPGRPKGARSKLGEDFLKALVADFNEVKGKGAKANGIEAIRKMRTDSPEQYVKVVASLLPKEITGENGEPIVTKIIREIVRPSHQDG